MTVTQQTLDDFFAYHPEFNDPTTYPDDILLRNLNDADSETGSKRWGSYSFNSDTMKASLKARGMFAYAAHRAALYVASSRATEAGIAASAPSRVSSKSVGDESVSYAVAAPSMAQSIGMGDLNTTIYGQEFLRLRRRAGAGLATTGQVRL